MRASRTYTQIHMAHAQTYTHTRIHTYTHTNTETKDTLQHEDTDLKPGVPCVLTSCFAGSSFVSKQHATQKSYSGT